MNNFLLVLVQGIVFVVGNTVCFCGCFWLFFKLVPKSTVTVKEKLSHSILMGLMSIWMFLVILGNLGGMLWVQSGYSNLNVFLLALSIFVYGSPFVFLVAATGAYIQSIYRDKFTEYINRHNAE